MPECPYTDWEDWSKCIGEFCGAGQVGSRTRTRNCIPAVSMTWKMKRKLELIIDIIAKDALINLILQCHILCM